MPNTLVHLGVQGIASRAVAPAVDLRLVYLSCVLPDLPWIVQRAVRVAAPEFDRITLAAWCGIQASLLFCLLLSAAIAIHGIHPRRAFAVLASGSLLHLLLDMLQVKWAHGAILFAPFDWRPRGFELLWPEHPVFYALLAVSLVFVALMWSKIDDGPLFRRPTTRRLAASATLAALYAFGPALFVPSMLDADVYFTRTLSDAQGRTGKEAWFDRAPLRRDEAGRPVMEIYTGEVVRLENFAGEGEGLVSVKGRFTGPYTVAVRSFHLHHVNVRTGASVAGLLFVTAVWARMVLNWHRRRRPPSPAPPQPNLNGRGCRRRRGSRHRHRSRE